MRHIHSWIKINQSEILWGYAYACLNLQVVYEVGMLSSERLLKIYNVGQPQVLSAYCGIRSTALDSINNAVWKMANWNSTPEMWSVPCSATTTSGLVNNPLVFAVLVTSDYSHKSLLSLFLVLHIVLQRRPLIIQFLFMFKATFMRRPGMVPITQ